jgi:hypothetical protein
MNTVMPLLTKKQASRFLGYKDSAGYPYLDWLMAEGYLRQVYLPGVIRPRFKASDLEALASYEKHETEPQVEELTNGTTKS